MINMETRIRVARITTNSIIAREREAPPHVCVNCKKVKAEIVPKTQINYETINQFWRNEMPQEAHKSERRIR
jgi:hypothetical protein